MKLFASLKDALNSNVTIKGITFFAMFLFSFWKLVEINIWIIKSIVKIIMFLF